MRKHITAKGHWSTFNGEELLGMSGSGCSSMSGPLNKGKEIKIRHWILGHPCVCFKDSKIVQSVCRNIEI